jgi:hypothetical protein
VLLLAVGGVGGAAAVAVATVPDGSGVIHACVGISDPGQPPLTNAANLTVIDPSAGQSCNSGGQTSISWNVQGRPGPTGPPGIPGTNTFTYTLVPPIVKTTAPSAGQVVLGSGRGAVTFDLLTYGFTPAATSAKGAGKISPKEFTISKTQDKASAKLFLYCANGKHIATGRITVRKTSGGKQRFLTFTFKSVLISSIQASSSQGGTRPLETLTLSFASFSEHLSK